MNTILDEAIDAQFDQRPPEEIQQTLAQHAQHKPVQVEEPSRESLDDELARLEQQAQSHTEQVRKIAERQNEIKKQKRQSAMLWARAAFRDLESFEGLEELAQLASDLRQRLPATSLEPTVRVIPTNTTPVVSSPAKSEVRRPTPPPLPAASKKVKLTGKRSQADVIASVMLDYTEPTHIKDIMADLAKEPDWKGNLQAAQSALAARQRAGKTKNHKQNRWSLTPRGRADAKAKSPETR